MNPSPSAGPMPKAAEDEGRLIWRRHRKESQRQIEIETGRALGNTERGADSIAIASKVIQRTFQEDNNRLVEETLRQ
jgi:hypothetical protein